MAAARVNVTTATGPATTILSETSDFAGVGNYIIRNLNASASVDLSNANTVTSGTGFPLLAGESLPIILEPGESLYGVSSSGTVSVAYLRVGT